MPDQKLSGSGGHSQNHNHLYQGGQEETMTSPKNPNGKEPYVVPSDLVDTDAAMRDFAKKHPGKRFTVSSGPKAATKGSRKVVKIKGTKKSKVRDEETDIKSPATV
jgi:hypothetical protein